ncbi:MAG TPA: MBL fold metallo-hydrolase [Ktedonobacteraceae bacterium]|nr:MBL fold metallo-hydrolase [Ktedonobacteraceae bacterium]
MYFKQLVKEDLGCASYIVGCPNAGVCAVVDPRLDMVDDILELAAQKDMRVTAVIETHNHADHVSGHGELARRTGATVYVHELAGVAYPHEDLRDGDELQLGVVRLRVIHTPGHRPEHIALVVADTSRGDDPWLVLTGDSLFIGDVARPDLAVAGEEGADALYESIFERLLKLDDGVEVYPAHVAGSLCGRGMNAKTSSTIGFERKHNPAIAPRPRPAFIVDMNEDLPQRPPNMYNIVERNREDYRHHPSPLEPLPLEAPAFRQAMADGAVVIDTRSPRHFGEGHIPQALDVYQHGSSFPTRVGFVASPDSRLLLVAEHEQDVPAATTQLAVVGYDRVVGYLAGGMAAWQEAGFPVQELAQMPVEYLHALLQAGNNGHLLVLDVRDRGEWNEGHIAEAKHLPYYFIEERVQELDPAQKTAVLCASGQRSTIACSLLQRHGFTELANIVGGMDAWKQAGFEVVAE